MPTGIRLNAGIPVAMKVIAIAGRSSPRKNPYMTAMPAPIMIWMTSSTGSHMRELTSSKTTMVR